MSEIKFYIKRDNNLEIKILKKNQFWYHAVIDLGKIEEFLKFLCFGYHAGLIFIISDTMPHAGDVYETYGMARLVKSLDRERQVLIWPRYKVVWLRVKIGLEPIVELDLDNRFCLFPQTSKSVLQFRINWLSTINFIYFQKKWRLEQK